LARLILLTQPEFVPAIAPHLRAHDPAIVLDLAVTLPQLEAALAKDSANTRVISFGSGVIVPAAVLTRLSGPAYNFHPVRRTMQVFSVGVRALRRRTRLRRDAA